MRLAAFQRAAKEETGSAYTRIRGLYRTCLFEPERLRAPESLVELLRVLAEEFAVQEDVMRQTGYPGIERHRLIHNRILAATEGVLEISGREGVESLRRRLPLLAQLVLNHQVGEDRVVGEYVRLRSGA